MAAAEHYVRKLGARLRFIALPSEQSPLPGVGWSLNLIATPLREPLIHGRVPDEFAIVEPWSSRPHPTLRASLRFEPLMPGSRVSLTGWYEAPSSFLGAVSDRLAGPQIVNAALQTFLDELVCSIELQFEQFCTGMKMTQAVAAPGLFRDDQRNAGTLDEYSRDAAEHQTAEV